MEKPIFKTHHKGRAISLIDADEAARRYYFFWLYQYVKRSQQWQDAWDLFNRAEQKPPGIDAAVKLIQQYKFIPPDVELFGPQKVWLRDEISGRGYLGGDPLTAYQILDAMLEIKAAQGNTGENIKCHYVHRYKHLFEDPHPTVDGATFDGENLVLADFQGKSKADLIQALSEYKDLIPEKNEWRQASRGKTPNTWHLPRAVGLVLYDLYLETGTRANAVTRFLSLYGEDRDEHGGDYRLPPTYRIADRDGLFRPLKKTVQCIETREVLPMK